MKWIYKLGTYITVLTAGCRVGAFALVALGSVVGLAIVGAVLSQRQRIVVVIAEKKVINIFRVSTWLYPWLKVPKHEIVREAFLTSIVSRPTKNPCYASVSEAFLVSMDLNPVLDVTYNWTIWIYFIRFLTLLANATLNGTKIRRQHQDQCRQYRQH